MTSDKRNDGIRKVEMLRMAHDYEEAGSLLKELETAFPGDDDIRALREALDKELDKPTDRREDVEAFFSEQSDDAAPANGGAPTLSESTIDTIESVLRGGSGEKSDSVGKLQEEVDRIRIQSEQVATSKQGLETELADLREAEQKRKDELSDAQSELEGLKQTIEAKDSTDKQEQQRSAQLEETIAAMEGDLGQLRDRAQTTSESKESLAKELQTLKASETEHAQSLSSAQDELEGLKHQVDVQKEKEAFLQEQVLGGGGKRAILRVLLLLAFLAVAVYGVWLVKQNGTTLDDLIPDSDSTPVVADDVDQTRVTEAVVTEEEPQKPQQRSAPAERVLVFPKESIGVVYTRSWNFTDDPESWPGSSAGQWVKLGEARGDITVAAGLDAKLELAYGNKGDVSALDSFSPDSLQAISLKGAAITDASLAHITHITGLEHLDLLTTDVTEDGLNMLAELRDLRSLNIYSLKTATGDFEILCELPKLQYLAIERTPIGTRGLQILKTLKPLKRLKLDPGYVEKVQLLLLEIKLPDCYITPKSGK